jgi:addiction module HigA family antidote
LREVGLLALSFGNTLAEDLFDGKNSKATKGFPPELRPFHPGEILLEEFLEPLGMSQAAFAEKIGWTKARLNELIRGKRGVTAEVALDLAEVLGTSAKLWMNFRATYDLDRAMKARDAA